MPIPKALTPAQKLRRLKTDARIRGFNEWLLRNGLSCPVEEWKFHPTRKWRFDFAWTDRKIALEQQGGLFSGGRHTRGAALLQEHEKLNAAAVLGWRVVFATPQNLKSREMLATLRQLLDR